MIWAYVFYVFNSCCVMVAPTTLPPRLEKLGLKLFKNELVLNDVISSISKPVELIVYGIKIYLVQRKGDNGLEKLNHEFSKGKDGYGLKRFTREQNGTMIDIGANIGAMSIYTAKKAPNCQVIAFEPIPRTYFYFRYNMYLNNITVLRKWECGTQTGGILPINQAVGAMHEIKEITYPSNQSQLATLSDSNYGHKINITVASFNDIIRRYDINVIHFLKIDCEGCEFEVIPSISERFTDRKKIHYIGAEIHQSLLDPYSKTIARRPNRTLIDSTLSILRRRGCGTTSWNIEC